MPLAAAVGAITGGTIIKAIGEKKEAKTAAKIAERNAAALRVEAEQEGQVSAEEQKRLGAEKLRKSSRLRVLAANAGIDIVGTPLLIAEEVAGEFAEERQSIGQAGRQRRFSLLSRAQQQRARGRNIRSASRFRTGSTLLTGATRAFSLLE